MACTPPPRLTSRAASLLRLCCERSWTTYLDKGVQVAVAAGHDQLVEGLKRKQKHIARVCAARQHAVRTNKGKGRGRKSGVRGPVYRSSPRGALHAANLNRWQLGRNRGQHSDRSDDYMFSNPSLGKACSSAKTNSSATVFRSARALPPIPPSPPTYSFRSIRQGLVRDKHTHWRVRMPHARRFVLLRKLPPLVRNRRSENTEGATQRQNFFYFSLCSSRQRAIAPPLPAGSSFLTLCGPPKKYRLPLKNECTAHKTTLNVLYILVCKHRSDPLWAVRSGHNYGCPEPTAAGTRETRLCTAWGNSTHGRYNTDGVGRHFPFAIHTKRTSKQVTKQHQPSKWWEANQDCSRPYRPRHKRACH